MNGHNRRRPPLTDTDTDTPKLTMPTNEHEKLRCLALVWGAMLGPAGFQRLVGHFGSTEAALDADIAALQAPGLRLTPEQVAMIPTLRERLDEFEEELDDLRGQNVAVLCPWDDDYPAALRELRAAPPVLCMAGRLLPQDGHAIAIVGTRTPTEAGFEMSRRLARAFAEADMTVVSGLARGCDTAAHLGALEGGGRTIAVLGSGIRVIHPRENLGLAREIAERGAVISEQPPGAHPTVGRLMARNRLQSALSRGVVVVESRAQGGAMETARHAREQGGAVYAVRWPDGREEGAGPNALLQDGAGALTGPEAVPRVRVELADHMARIARRRRTQTGQRTLFDAPGEDGE